MTADDRLDDLLDRWGQLRSEGRDLSAGELCRDCPELAEEAARRIEFLRHMDRLMQPPVDASAESSALSGPLAPTAGPWDDRPPAPAGAAPAQGPDELG